MAKTAKVKKRQVTVHSRAARRAASPSIDLDKTLKQTTRDSASSSRPSQATPRALAAQNAGVQKKNKKGNMTRAQRLRHQKGLKRAAHNLDKMQVKVVKSLGKERKVKERSKGWEDVNEEGKKKKKTATAMATGQDMDEGTEQAKRTERAWVSDEDMDDTETTMQERPTLQNGQVKGEGKQVDLVTPESVPLTVEEDEML